MVGRCDLLGWLMVRLLLDGPSPTSHATLSQVLQVDNVPYITYSVFTKAGHRHIHILHHYSI